MKKWALKWLRAKSLEATELEKTIQFAALHGLLDIHGFWGGGMIMWRMGMKIMRQQAELVRQQKEGK